jgi:hypothetical protein
MTIRNPSPSASLLPSRGPSLAHRSPSAVPLSGLTSMPNTSQLEQSCYLVSLVGARVYFQTDHLQKVTDVLSVAVVFILVAVAAVRHLYLLQLFLDPRLVMFSHLRAVIYLSLAVLCNLLVCNVVPFCLPSLCTPSPCSCAPSSYLPLSSKLPFHQFFKLLLFKNLDLLQLPDLPHRIPTIFSVSSSSFLFSLRLSEGKGTCFLFLPLCLSAWFKFTL